VVVVVGCCTRAVMESRISPDLCSSRRGRRQSTQCCCGPFCCPGVEMTGTEYGPSFFYKRVIETAAGGRIARAPLSLYLVPVAASGDLPNYLVLLLPLPLVLLPHYHFHPRH